MDKMDNRPPEIKQLVQDMTKVLELLGLKKEELTVMILGDKAPRNEEACASAQDSIQKIFEDCGAEIRDSNILYCVEDKTAVSCIILRVYGHQILYQPGVNFIQEQFQGRSRIVKTKILPLGDGIKANKLSWPEFKSTVMGTVELLAAGKKA